MISSDEKCASAILDFEAMIKAEQSNPTFQIPDFNPGTVGTVDDFLDNLFKQEHTIPDFEAFSFDDSTLDFNDLCRLGLDGSGTSFPEF